jgi:hypothetical protein
VLRGWAAEPLLESYERERRPVAEFNTERSTRDDGSILGTALGLGADIGGRISHAWVERDGALVSTLDLLSNGLTLLVGRQWNGALPAGESGSPPLTIERLDEIAARGLGLTASGSLLVRPDGHPVALWNWMGSRNESLWPIRLSACCSPDRTAREQSDGSPSAFSSWQ